MIIPIHIALDTALAYSAYKSGLATVNYVDLILMLSAGLIDLDHFFSKPIYHPRRNPFKTHFLHKYWIAVLAGSLMFIAIRPVMFLGIGLISHLSLDYLYIKLYKIKK